MSCIITTHAYKRAKERTGWNKNAVHRMADKALRTGICRSRASGPFKRYLDNIVSGEYGPCDNVRVYGYFVFLFTGSILITIFHLPNKYKVNVEALK